MCLAPSLGQRQRQKQPVNQRAEQQSKKSNEKNCKQQNDQHQGLGKHLKALIKEQAQERRKKNGNVTCVDYK